MNKNLLNKVFVRSIILLALPMLLISCESNLSNDAFLLQTGEVTEIDSSGAVFKALLVREGSDQVIDHGFVWSIGSKYPRTELDFKKSLGSELNGQTFTAKITGGEIESDTVIHVRAYIKTSKGTSYGSDVTFIYPLYLSAGTGDPVITSISPDPMTWYDTVTITGDNFSYLNQEISVKVQEFGAYYYSIPALKSTRKTIKILLQYAIRISNPDIYVKVKGKESNHVTGNMSPPEVLSITPTSGKINQMVTLFGRNLGYNWIETEIRFNDLPATLITPKTIGFQRVWLPGTLAPGPATVKVSFLGMGKEMSTTRTDFFTLTTK